jgi:hypothetical protein
VQEDSNSHNIVRIFDKISPRFVEYVGSNKRVTANTGRILRQIHQRSSKCGLSFLTKNKSGKPLQGVIQKKEYIFVEPISFFANTPDLNVDIQGGGVSWC